jgi:4-amino-4-deoxy-L-arabinose transferase-like glycosyltransferase
MMHGMLFRKWRVWGSVAGLLLLGASLRLWFLHHANPFSGDAQIYGSFARNLLTHHVYSFAAEPGPFPPSLIRLPGYPLFLVACFVIAGVGNFAAALRIQIAVDLASCLMLAELAREMFGRRAALVCLLLGCLCPFTANYTAAPLTETLTLASITVTFFCFHRWQRQSGFGNAWVFGIGAGLAASLLLRPEQALLSVAVLPAMVLIALRRCKAYAAEGARVSPRVFAPALIAAVCLVLPLVPWTARNWRTFHVLQPLAPRYATDPGEAVPLGFQRWYRSWAIDFASTEEVYWNYDGTAIALADLPARAFDSLDQRRQTAKLLEDYNLTTSPSPQLDARFEAIARERIARSPARYYVFLPLARLGNMLLRPRTELTGIQLAWWRWRDSHAQTIMGAALGSVNLLYLVLGMMGWRRWRRLADSEDRVLLRAMTAFVLLRCALLFTLDNSEPRYTLEFFPVLILWASALAARRRPISSGLSSSRS